MGRAKHGGAQTPRVVQIDGPLSYAQATQRIKKLWTQGQVTPTPYAGERMRQRRLTMLDVEAIMKTGWVVEHSKPSNHWRYTVVGKLVDGRRAQFIAELHGALVVVINAYRRSS